MCLNSRIIFLVPLRCNSKHLNFVAPATEMQCAAVFSDNQHECKEVIITVCQTSGFSTQLLSKAIYPKYNKKSVVFGHRGVSTENFCNLAKYSTSEGVYLYAQIKNKTVNFVFFKCTFVEEIG